MRFSSSVIQPHTRSVLGGPRGLSRPSLAPRSGTGRRDADYRKNSNNTALCTGTAVDFVRPHHSSSLGGYSPISLPVGKRVDDNVSPLIMGRKFPYGLPALPRRPHYSSSHYSSSHTSAACPRPQPTSRVPPSSSECPTPVCSWMTSDSCESGERSERSERSESRGGCTPSSPTHSVIACSEGSSTPAGSSGGGCSSDSPPQPPQRPSPTTECKTNQSSSSSSSTSSSSSSSSPSSSPSFFTTSRGDDDQSISCSIERQWTRVSTVESWSKKPIRPMTMRRLMETAAEAKHKSNAVLLAAEWVRTELPIRIAHRLYDFHRLPYAVLCNPHIRETYDTYARTFDVLMGVSRLSELGDVDEFQNILYREKGEHDRTVDLMGRGIQQLKYVCGTDFELDHFLERFFFFRIGRKIMIEQLLSLQRPVEGYIGCFNLACNPKTVIEVSANEVRECCRASYGIAPPFTISLGSMHSTISFTCIPDHLSLIITEVLKNAMRATVEFYTLGSSGMDISETSLVTDDSDLPPVRIEIYKGRSEIVIKVSDKGGGIAPRKLADVWSFGYSTVNEMSTYPPGGLGMIGGGACLVRPEMAGYGFGLPLSRAFARYFGGDLNIQSHFGVGTDVYITMNHVGDQAEALFYEERDDLKILHHSKAAGISRRGTPSR